MEMGTFCALGGDGGFGGGGLGGVSGIGRVFLVHYVNTRDTLSLTPPWLGLGAVLSAGMHPQAGPTCIPIRAGMHPDQSQPGPRAGLGSIARRQRGETLKRSCRS